MRRVGGTTIRSIRAVGSAPNYRRGQQSLGAGRRDDSDLDERQRPYRDDTRCNHGMR